MSVGADSQMTLRDYFARHNGIEHVLITNILNDSIEFYIRPINAKEIDGMHFRLSMSGQMTEVGAWQQTIKEEQKAQKDAQSKVDSDKVIDDANEANGA